MAQSADIVWEVRTAGAATNGGGFKTGASGTDWTQQSAAQYSVTDGVTAGTTTITSATANFGTDVVGNIIYVQGGTGSVTAGWYEITARTNATTITVDRSTGLTAGTGVTLKIGGALNSLNTLASAFGTIGQHAFIKADGTYTQTANPSFSLDGTPSNTVNWSRISGYTTTRGDNGRAAITLSTNSNLRGVECTGGGWMIENLDINCASLSGSRGVSHSGNYSRTVNCKVSNYRDYGIISGVNYNSVLGCEITGGTTGATAGILCNAGSGHTVYGNYIHDNSVGHGISASGSASIAFNIVANCTQSGTANGILLSLYGFGVYCNTVYGNGLNGIYISSSFQIPSIVKGNLVANHTNGSGSGIKFNGSGAIAASPFIDGNAYYNNTANRTNGDGTSGNNATGAYTNVYDVSITDGSPFVNAGSSDFRLNGTALRGALLRGTAQLGMHPGLSPQTNYLDFGALQSPPSGSRSQTVNAG